jgi:hypothetical protein
MQHGIPWDLAHFGRALANMYLETGSKPERLLLGP